MKLKRVVTFLWGAGLAFLLSLSAAACLITAFDIAVDMKALALCCWVAAVVAGLCYTLKLGLVPLGTGAVLLGYLWQKGSLLPSFAVLISEISRQYDRAYGWGALQWDASVPEGIDPTLALCVIAVLITMAVAWAICRRKSAVPGFLLSLLPFAACLVVTDRVPKMPWLYFLLLGLGMLLLTHTTRRQDEQQGNRLSAMVALPVALSLLIMFAACPQERYTGQAEAQHMVDTILNMEPVRTIVSYFTESGTTGTEGDGRSVNLKGIGYRVSNYAEILQLQTDIRDIVYLRGRALDTYDGISWTDSGSSTGELGWPVASSMETKYEATIATRYGHQMLYVPYNTVSRDLQYMTVGLENEKKLSQYSFTCQKIASEDYFNALYPTEDTWRFADTELMQSHTHLSDSVRQWAEPLAQELTAGMNSYYHKAQAIRNYVRSSASYDTFTQRMPANRDDFAQWFLEESDTGYCVHFATAATVLLQAAGIPARYVTGYMIDMRNSSSLTVRSDDSHAWAEYWLPGYGWTVLEATPASQELAEPTEPTEQTTEPTETQPQTEETEPTVQESRPIAPTPVKKEKIDLTALWVILAILAAGGVTEGQRRLRLYLRQRRLDRGNTNQQALSRWQEATRMAALLKQTPDGQLLELAMMAKFSQHTLTPEQVALFDDYLSAAQKALNKRSVCHRFWYRVVLVVY